MHTAPSKASAPQLRGAVRMPRTPRQRRGQAAEAGGMDVRQLQQRADHLRRPIGVSEALGLQHAELRRLMEGLKRCSEVPTATFLARS